MKHVLFMALALAGCATPRNRVAPAPAGYYGESMSMYDRWQGASSRIGGGHTGGTSDFPPPPPLPRRF